MMRIALIWSVAAILCVVSPTTMPLASSHVRLPESPQQASSAIAVDETDWGRSEIAAWVQAIGSILAILVAVGVGWGSHIRDENTRRRDAEQRRQRILSALYVEVFGRAARCARDAYTWRAEVAYERERGMEIPDLPKCRKIIDLLKFEPSPPVVYPALAESHGLLDPDAQAALSEFYYRLEAVIRDVRRFALRNWDTDMEPGDTQHFAHVLHGACAPALEAIKQLRTGLDDHADLDRKLSKSWHKMLTDPPLLGDTIDAALAHFVNVEPPNIRA